MVLTPSARVVVYKQFVVLAMVVEQLATVDVQDGDDDDDVMNDTAVPDGGRR